jgi:NADH-quinone oxidoreductase subunit M
VYNTSQYKKGVQASLYFLIWTQLGSFLVLICIAYIINVVGGTNFFFLKNFVFTSFESYCLYFLLFLGFGFKIPIWPFHFWLTKTHVEAPAGFSIFLSGFLVKSAVYGFYRLSNVLGNDVNTILFAIFPMLGVIDSSFKMWAQLDLKKLVAYCTVQEMSLLYLAFIWGDNNCFIGGVLLCITHSLLSSLMFFLVDCTQRRYKTRLITELSGILHRTPNLGISLILMVVLYSGLPGSLKFTSEFYIYTGLFESTPLLSTLMIFSSNFFGILGFSKCWCNVIFGLSMKNQKFLQIDLNFKEFWIIFICLFSSFLFNFNTNVLFI